MPPDLPLWIISAVAGGTAYFACWSAVGLYGIESRLSPRLAAISAVVDGGQETTAPEARMNRELPSEPLPSGANRLRYLPLALMIVAGTALSLAVFAALRCGESRQIRTEFEVVVRARAAAVEAAVKENDHVLDAVRSPHGAVAKVDRTDFRPSVSQRKERFRGAVPGVHCMSDLVKEALLRLPPESVEICCFNLNAPKGEQLFYRYPSEARSDWPAISTDPPGEQDDLRQVIDIDAAGGRWRLAFGPGPTFVAQRRTWQPWIVLAMGLLMTVAGNTIIFVTINRVGRDERMLREHAAELERSREQYRSLVENIDQGITLIDRNFNIVTDQCQPGPHVWPAAGAVHRQEVLSRVREAGRPLCPLSRSADDGDGAALRR